VDARDKRGHDGISVHQDRISDLPFSAKMLRTAATAGAKCPLDVPGF
jgi:hypothetical protein